TPSSWPYQNTRGAALYRAGQLDAVEWLQKAAKIAPEGGSPYDWLFLAMAYHRLGKKAPARQSLDKSVARVNDRPRPGSGRRAPLGQPAPVAGAAGIATASPGGRNAHQQVGRVPPLTNHH